jgi:hypothetical protein
MDYLKIDLAQLVKGLQPLQGAAGSLGKMARGLKQAFLAEQIRSVRTELDQGLDICIRGARRDRQPEDEYLELAAMVMAFTDDDGDANQRNTATMLALAIRRLAADPSQAPGSLHPETLETIPPAEEQP